MTGITDAGIEIERDLEAAPADVFEAWTDARHFARWFGGSAVEVPIESLDYDAVEGRTWAATMVLPNGASIEWAGDFLEVTPAERLVMTITDTPGAPERARITVDVEPRDGGSHMRFAQEAPGFSSEQKEMLLAGWQSFLDELESGLLAAPPKDE
jgi:uncharacterized protein YndB with AHSA1/START domain